MIEEPMPPGSVHIPVLLAEVVSALKPAPGNAVIDATINGGGHAGALLREIGPTGRLLGLDRDPVVLDRLRTAAAPDVTAGRLRLVAANFVDIAEVAKSEGFIGADAIMFDLGLSTHHLEASGRGFSFDRDEPLDLRFDTRDPELRPAAHFLKRVRAGILGGIIATYGEERHAHRIARHIVRIRERRPIETATALRNCVLEALPPPARPHGTRSVARVFQALRIVTNGELEALEHALPQVPALLRPGGRVAVIAFHSLEDRIVKRFFRQAAANSDLRILTKKPLRPGIAETRDNPRARSARLRVAERPTAL
jgi:16S rRNA (cytosine1402-N4)-methyltransferase